MEIHSQVKRLEQQLDAFEKLHKGELADFERKLSILEKLQTDEVQMIRNEVTKLKSAIEKGLTTLSPNQDHNQKNENV